MLGRTKPGFTARAARLRRVAETGSRNPRRTSNSGRISTCGLCSAPMLRLAALFILSLSFATGPASADKLAYLELARQGWNYQLRTTMVGRDMGIRVHINGRDLAGAALCVVGERPHAQTDEVLEAFRGLLHHSFGKPVPMRYAGPDARACGSGRTVILRLYSGHPPSSALSADLEWMSEAYRLGLPKGRQYAVSSPAMGQTFFGYRGQGTHLMVKQPALDYPGTLERAFYSSILIEELYQAFTFGMDVLHFDPTVPFLSKLQESPQRMMRLPWESRSFMRALLRSNPGRLCAFDVFMLHAVGRAPVDQTVEPQFIEYIDTHFDQLTQLAEDTMTDPRFEGIVDRTCRRPA